MQQRLIRYRTMDRCDEPPIQQAFTEVGTYRFLTP
jgi:hypothetical protein